MPFGMIRPGLAGFSRSALLLAFFFAFTQGVFHSPLTVRPGYPDATTRFPQQMLVDWVRVYGR